MLAVNPVYQADAVVESVASEDMEYQVKKSQSSQITTDEITNSAYAASEAKILANESFYTNKSVDDDDEIAEDQVMKPQVRPRNIVETNRSMDNDEDGEYEVMKLQNTILSNDDNEYVDIRPRQANVDMAKNSAYVSTKIV